MQDDYLTTVLSDNIYIVNTDAYSANDANQRRENLRAVAKRLGNMLLSHGHKVFAYCEKTELTGDILSALRRTVTVSDSLTEDVRCILVIGGGEMINTAKQMCATLSVPLFVWWTSPDSDTILSPFFKDKIEGIPRIRKCEPPKAVFVDPSALISKTALKQGVGLVAKSLVTLFERGNSHSDWKKPLTDALRECMLTDFSNPQKETIVSLYLSLLKISALRTHENGLLLSAVDNLTNTLDFLGAKGDKYAYPCARIVTELCRDIAAVAPIISFPPDNIKRTLLLSALKAPLVEYEASTAIFSSQSHIIKTANCQTESKTPCQNNDEFDAYSNESSLTTKSQTADDNPNRDDDMFPSYERSIEFCKSLAIFESFCTDKLPLSPSMLKQLIVLSVNLYSQKTPLRSIYLSGLLG